MSHDVTQLRASWVRKIDITRVDDVVVPGECWLWRGAVDKDSGYGRVYVAHKCLHLHRVTYETFIGPIPEGLHIDHLCRVRGCCNPGHLEAVTPATNIRRGSRATQTHCKNDHLLSGENLYLSPGSKPQYKHRQCRTCRDAYMAEWRAKRKQRKADTWAMYLGDQGTAA